MFQKYFPQVGYLKAKNQVYLDSAATTLKPLCVINTLKQFYEQEVANVHRGDHYLSAKATLRYEGARYEVQKWIQAQHPEQVIFTKSTTEGLNFLAFALKDYFSPGDEILLTEMEHHSNLLPWQALAKSQNLTLKFLPLTQQGELDLSHWDKLVSSKTKLFAFTWYSNALGVRNPVEKLCTLSKKRNIITVIDGAQAMTAEPVDVQSIGCDFLAFSGHKLFAPFGLGVLYARKELLPMLKPWQLGGGMVVDVTRQNYEKAHPPYCFEAGTPPIDSALALEAVLKFLKQKDFFKEVKKLSKLLSYAEEELKKIAGIKIIGNSSTKKNILSFILEGTHSRDLGQLISQAGVAVRSGHHCCLPLMKKLNLPSGTVRASFSVYNDKQDVELFISALKKAKNILGV